MQEPLAKRLLFMIVEALFEVVDALDDEHRAEDLLAADLHVLGHVVEDRRADEEAALVAGDDEVATVEDEVGALFDALVDPAP